MTAPGNAALIFLLTAVFVACAGYAAGRLHQRFQEAQDREEAYRDGYDTATRSIFGMAARLIGPRRSTRAAAAVRPVLDGAVVEQRTALPSASGVPLPRPGEFLASSSRSGEFLASSSRSGEFPGSSSRSGEFPGFSSRSGEFPGFSSSSGEFPGFSSSSGEFPGSSSGSASLAGAGPASVPDSPAGARPPSGPREAPVPWAPSESEHDAVSLGFPVPPHPPSRIIGEPGAMGGVIYRPFPDPRFVGNAEPLPADRGSFHVPRPTLAAFASDPTSAEPGVAATGLPPDGRPSIGVAATGLPPHGRPSIGVASAGLPSGVPPAGVPSTGAASAGAASAGVPASGAPSGGYPARGSDVAPPAGGAGPLMAEAGEESGSSGRHTVPDELVQAATYRLPADRVFRARVPDAATAPALPDEPTTRLSVPKPRQS